MAIRIKFEGFMFNKRTGLTKAFFSSSLEWISEILVGTFSFSTSLSFHCRPSFV
jgi:hypothetical protein